MQRRESIAKVMYTKRSDVFDVRRDGVRVPHALGGMLAGLLLMGLLGCAATSDDDEMRGDPREAQAVRQTDYGTLEALVRVIENSSRNLRELLNTTEYRLINRHSENLRVYTDDMRHFRPQNRTFAAVQRYDTYVRSLQAQADGVEHAARLRKLIQVRQELDALDVYVGYVRALMAEPADADTQGTFRERLSLAPN